MTNFIKTAAVRETQYALDDKGRIIICDNGDPSIVLKANRTEAEFDDFIAEELTHRNQLDTLGRRSAQDGKYSMWGQTHTATFYSNDIIRVTTAGHGGFILEDEANNKIHPAWRISNGQYEEDCDWSIVAITFPKLFTDKELKYAHAGAKNYLPDQYEAATGTPVDISESRELQERQAKKQNENRMVVVSAIGEGDEVRCTATLGGDRNGERKTYMVPRDEYKLAIGGFVIDETKHREIPLAA